MVQLCGHMGFSRLFRLRVLILCVGVGLKCRLEDPSLMESDPPLANSLIASRICPRPCQLMSKSRNVGRMPAESGSNLKPIKVDRVRAKMCPDSGQIRPKLAGSEFGTAFDRFGWLGINQMRRLPSSPGCGIGRRRRCSRHAYGTGSLGLPQCYEFARRTNKRCPIPE